MAADGAARQQSSIDAVRTRRWAVLALVSVGQFMVLVDDTIVNVALPTIRDDFGVAERDLAWIVNAYLLLFGGFLLVGGRAADLFGRRRMLIAAVGLFILSSLLCGLAASTGMLVGARGLQGFAGALLSPAALSILLATFPEARERTTALAIWASLIGLGATTGLVLGGALTESVGWRWVFLVNVPIGVVLLALAPRLVRPDGARAARRDLDLAGAILATTSLLTLVYTVIETDSRGWTSARTLGGLGLSAVLMVVFAGRERTTMRPLVPTSVVRRRTVIAANGMMLLAAAALLAMFFFLTLYMQLVQGWSPLETGLAYLPFEAMVVVFSGVAAWTLKRGFTRTLLTVGTLTGATGFLLLSGLERGASYSSELLPALIVVGAGLGLAFVPLTTAATAGVRAESSGLASGLLTTSQQIGGAIGIAALVTVATDRAASMAAEGSAPQAAMVEGFQLAFILSAGLLLAAALVAPLMGRVRATGAPLPV